MAKKVWERAHGCGTHWYYCIPQHLEAVSWNNGVVIVGPSKDPGRGSTLWGWSALLQNTVCASNQELISVIYSAVSSTAKVCRLRNWGEVAVVLCITNLSPNHQYLIVMMSMIQIQLLISPSLPSQNLLLLYSGSGWVVCLFFQSSEPEIWELL